MYDKNTITTNSNYFDGLQPNQNNKKNIKQEIFSLLLDRKKSEATELMVKHLKSIRIFFLLDQI